MPNCCSHPFTHSLRQTRSPRQPMIARPTQSALLSRCIQTSPLTGDSSLVHDLRKALVMRALGHVLLTFSGALLLLPMLQPSERVFLRRNTIICDQDQWDIHKLDPFYECFVPSPPHVPTIRAKVQSVPSFARSSTSSRSSTFAEGPQKRRLSTPPSSLEEDNEQSPKKRRQVISVVDSDSEDEAEISVKPNRPRQTLRTYVPGRRVRERRGGFRRVPMSRTTWGNTQAVPPTEPPDEEMRSTTPPRTPTSSTAPPLTSKRRKGAIHSIHISTHSLGSCFAR
jgi:hypothetical protein